MITYPVVSHRLAHISQHIRRISHHARLLSPCHDRDILYRRFRDQLGRAVRCHFCNSLCYTHTHTHTHTPIQFPFVRFVQLNEFGIFFDPITKCSLNSIHLLLMTSIYERAD